MKLQKVTHASHKLLLRESVTYRKHLKVSNFSFEICLICISRQTYIQYNVSDMPVLTSFQTMTQWKLYEAQFVRQLKMKIRKTEIHMTKVSKADSVIKFQQFFQLADHVKHRIFALVSHTMIRSTVLDCQIYNQHIFKWAKGEE